MHLDHQSLLVKDVQKSADFYRDVLGLIVVRSNGEPISGIWMGNTTGKDLFHLNQGEAGAHFPKGHHIALRTDEFDTLVARIASLGINYVDWAGATGRVGRHPLGFRQIYLTDPDGHWIELNDVEEPPA